mmetsp:Transcript_3533/g.6815  ORF Transcript_3533/g.6815 Transcript_3533/m.6815 type:complete len:339 (+) Transcript_3533:83-1099(+)
MESEALSGPWWGPSPRLVGSGKGLITNERLTPHSQAKVTALPGTMEKLSADRERIEGLGPPSILSREVAILPGMPPPPLARASLALLPHTLDLLEHDRKKTEDKLVCQASDRSKVSSFTSTGLWTTPRGAPSVQSPGPLPPWHGRGCLAPATVVGLTDSYELREKWQAPVPKACSVASKPPAAATALYYGTGSTRRRPELQLARGKAGYEETEIFLEALFGEYASATDVIGRPLMNCSAMHRFLRDFIPRDEAVEAVFTDANVKFAGELNRQCDLNFRFGLSKSDAMHGLCYEAFHVFLDLLLPGGRAHGIAHARLEEHQGNPMAMRTRGARAAGEPP